MGAMAYMVTFRETDPLYAVDLSDPTNPTVLDALKVNIASLPRFNLVALFRCLASLPFFAAFAAFTAFAAFAAFAISLFRYFDSSRAYRANNPLTRQSVNQPLSATIACIGAGFLVVSPPDWHNRSWDPSRTSGRGEDDAVSTSELEQHTSCSGHLLEDVHFRRR
jgi:hypothetical protein